jgi:ankyrin repeat protein/Tfp pilus assembly protein PilF
MGLIDLFVSKESRLKNLIKDRNVSEVIKLIKGGADVNTRTEKGETAIWLAIERENKELAEIVLSKDVDLELVYEEGNSALMKALIQNNSEMINLLIEKGAGINRVNDNGVSPLIHVLLQKDFKTAEKLVSRGAERQIYKDQSILWLILPYNSSVYLIKELIDKGVAIDQENNDGYTELMFAIKEDKKELVDLFLDYGADVNFYSKKINATPMSIAIQNGAAEYVSTLIDNKVDINAKFQSLGTPITIAIKNGMDKIIDILISNGAKIDAKSDVLFNAIYSNHEGVVEKLLKLGADVNSTKNYVVSDVNSIFRFSPLMAAIQQENISIVNLLINHGADIHFQSEGISPLVYALKSQNDSIVKIFTDQGVKPKAIDYYNASRFHYRIDDSETELFISFMSEEDQLPVLLSEALNLDANFANAYGYRGAFYFTIGLQSGNESMARKGLDDLSMAINLGCKEAIIYFQWARANDEFGIIDAAIDGYTKYLALRPKDVNAYNNRGNIYQNLSKYDLAEKDFSNMILNEKHTAMGFKNRGNLYIVLGKEDQAIKDWEKGLKIAPSDLVLNKNTGLYYYNQIAANPDYVTVDLIEKSLKHLKLSKDYGDEQSKKWYDALVNRYKYDPFS